MARGLHCFGGLVLLGVLACDRGAAQGPALDGGDARADRPPTADAPAPEAAPAPASLGTVALAELPAAIGRVICAKRFACCSRDERDRAGFAPDEATCATRLERALALMLPEIERSVNARRADYDGAALGRCLDAYQALACPSARVDVPFAISIAGCPYLVPRTELGAACGQGFECSGGYCMGVGIDRDGRCVPKKSDGVACQALDECTGGHCHPEAETCAQPPVRSICQSAV